MGATISGLGSGFDWQSMVDQLKQVQTQQLINPLNSQKTRASDKQSAWGALGTKLSSLKTAVVDLKYSYNFQVYKPGLSSSSSSVSAESLLGVSTSADAGKGRYDIQVVNQARAEKLQSSSVSSTTSPVNWPDVDAASTISIKGRQVQLWDAATGQAKSLQQLRNDINALNTGSNPTGVVASILQISNSDYRLLLTSQSEGAAGIIYVDSYASGDYFTSPDKPQNQLSGSVASTTDTPWAGSVTLNDTTGGGAHTVDLSGKTVEQIRDEINSYRDTTGISARIMQVAESDYRLVLAGARDTAAWGASPNGNFNDGSTGNIFSPAGGEDALLTIDGLSIFRSTNSIADAIPGVTLKVLGENASTVVTADISLDQDALQKKVQKFIDSYNDIIDYLNKQNTYDANTKKTGGPLFGDASAKSIKNALQNNFLNARITPSGGDTRYLSSLGITIGSDNKLTLNSDKLKTALETDFSSAVSLFNTMAQTFDMYLDTATNSLDGTVTVQQKTAQSLMDHLDDKIESAQMRIDRQMEMLTNQFIKMDSALNQMQSQSSWLSNQLSKM